MATEFSVHGSITVKRLRTGATLNLVLKASGQLWQIVNMDNGNVTPNWKEEANQPVITPSATVTQSGNSVSISETSEQGWWYNTEHLSFTGSESNGWIEERRDNGEAARFAYNSSTHALKIIDNLASKDNYASDTLQFVCTVEYEGSYYEMSASTVVMITPGGTTGYQGYVQAGTQLLNEADTSTRITATLVNGDSFVREFSTKWYWGFVDDDHEFVPHGDSLLNATDYSAYITVDRNDVNGGNNNDENNSLTGGTLFICQFYNTEGTLVATAGINIVDEADEYSVQMGIASDSDATTLDAGNVTVTASIFSNSRAGIVADYVSATFEFNVLDGEFNPVSGAGATVTDPTNGIARYEVKSEYSTDGNDVLVTCDATFTINV